MIRRPPRSTRTYTLLPYTTLFRSYLAANPTIVLPDGSSANPLAGLKAFQFLPPFLNVPNAVEPGKTHDKDLAWSARLAYELTDTVNVYATYATGFKASSINLSRDSRPLESDLPAIGAAGLTTTNLGGGTRLAGPEESEVYELGPRPGERRGGKEGG